MVPTTEQINAFYQNPLIQQLAQQPKWTISDGKKLPLNIKASLASNFKEQKMFSYKNNGLAKLTDFDQQVPQNITNRTIRFNMQYLHTMGLDIEPSYDHKKWDPYLRWLPIDYIEYSTHNGYHMLVHIPNAIYNKPEIQKILLEHTNMQFLEEGKKHQGIEFLFNKHFMNLTRRVVVNKNEYPFQPYDVPPENRIKAIEAIILKISKDYDQKHVTFNINGNDFANIDQSLIEQAKIIKTYITDDDIERAKQTATKNATKNSGELDLSRVEWRFISSLHGFYKQLPKSTPIVVSLQQQLNIPNSNDLIKQLQDIKVESIVLTMLAKDNLTPRKKWNTKRNGVPWLLSNSIKVIQYFTQQDQPKK